MVVMVAGVAAIVVEDVVERLFDGVVVAVAEAVAGVGAELVVESSTLAAMTEERGPVGSGADC